MASPSASSSSATLPQSTPSKKYLFGGDRSWDSSQWTASDDRVRGGRSQSHLTVSCGGPGGGGAARAEFSGHLDISALGGAGFASQRTVDDLYCWDLSGYDALVLDVAKADEKRYTLIIKDTILPRRDDGREQSTVSWEYDFVVPGDKIGYENGCKTAVVMPLADFQPTYRGRPTPDAKPLDLTHVKRISLMMRSFFGDQQGDFSLTINFLAATTDASATTDLQRSRRSSPDALDNAGDYAQSDDKDNVENGVGTKHDSNSKPGATSWLDWLRGLWSR